MDLLWAAAYLLPGLPRLGKAILGQFEHELLGQKRAVARRVERKVEFGRVAGRKHAHFDVEHQMHGLGLGGRLLVGAISRGRRGSTATVGR